jgi:hypothetical protein
VDLRDMIKTRDILNVFSKKSIHVGPLVIGARPRIVLQFEGQSD